MNGNIINEIKKDEINSSDLAEVMLGIRELNRVYDYIQNSQSTVNLLQTKSMIRPVIVQTRLDNSNDLNKINKSYFVLLEESRNRLVRLIWSILIVVLISAMCFVFVKTSIDWAQNSKQELNKIKETQSRAITDEINRKYAFIRTEC